MSMGLPTLRPRIGVVDLRTAALPPKVAERFYSSAEWIALRDRVRREADERCQAQGCGRAERRMYVDHIVELKDGGAPLDRSNVWLLCGAHRVAKTGLERARRTASRPALLISGAFRGANRTGLTPRIFPVCQYLQEPAHFWASSQRATMDR